LFPKRQPRPRFAGSERNGGNGLPLHSGNNNLSGEKTPAWKASSPFFRGKDGQVPYSIMRRTVSGPSLRKRGERMSAERKKDAVKGFPDLEEGQAPCREICHGIEKHACTGNAASGKVSSPRKPLHPDTRRINGRPFRKNGLRTFSFCALPQKEAAFTEPPWK